MDDSSEINVKEGGAMEEDGVMEMEGGDMVLPLLLPLLSHLFDNGLDVLG